MISDTAAALRIRAEFAKFHTEKAIEALSRKDGAALAEAVRNAHLSAGAVSRLVNDLLAQVVELAADVDEACARNRPDLITPAPAPAREREPGDPF